MRRVPDFHLTLRNFTRYHRLVTRRAWKFYRGGGLVIGLVWLWTFFALPVEMVRRSIARLRRQHASLHPHLPRTTH